MENPRTRENRLSFDEGRISSALVSVGARAASHSVAEAMTNLTKDRQFRLSSISSPRSSLSVTDGTHIWTHQGFSPSDVRPSRASSVISTHTKTSITTVHEEIREGVDVRIGQEAVFRLGLDGSTTYVNHVRSQQSAHLERALPDLDGNIFRSTSNTMGPPQPPPTLIGEPSGADIVARNPSFKPGDERITVQRRRSSSNSASIQDNSSRPATAEKESPRLRRRGGVRLKVVTRNSSGQIVKGSSPLSPNSATSYQTTSSQHSGSARPDDDAQPASPAYIGRHASGTFPSAESFVSGYAALTLAETGDRDVPLTDRLCKNSGAPVPARGLGAQSRPSQESIYPENPVNATSPSLIVTESPAHVDDLAVGAHRPLSMDTENDVTIHYSRIVRTIDTNYRNHMQAKDQELSEARDMLKGLARQAIDLKAELIRTKSQVAAMSDPAHIRKMAREQTLEAQSFSFPPLKLNHVRTLKMALKRRAEKMRRGLDDDLGWLIRTTSSSSEDPGKQPTDQGENNSLVDDQEEISKRAGNFDAPTNGEAKDREAELVESLLLARRRLRSLETEEQILQGQVINLRETVNIWKSRCEKLEQERKQNPSNELMDEVARAKREVERLWEARWHHRTEQLSERTRRIEEDAQKAFQDAVAAKDKRLFELEERCSRLSATMKEKEEETERLRSKSNSSNSDS
ncbi:MAG: hypothetical protein M1816_001715 [Peltula sp. TS41687]|nr:MAG: hypothetical protein M1816_001715 [Peltula sp. TS41687]